MQKLFGDMIDMKSSITVLRHLSRYCLYTEIIPHQTFAVSYDSIPYIEAFDLQLRLRNIQMPHIDDFFRIKRISAAFKLTISS